MADNNETYRRMPSTALGTLLRFFSRSNAWLADDHILVTKTMFWVERYNRFYLSDIQAVAICKTQVGLVWNILLGLGAGLLAAAGLLDGFGLAILVWLAIFTVPLAINIAMGPTCICCVYTAVNIHKLSCFNRISKAMVFLRTVKPLVTQVQGQVSDDEILERAPLIPPLQRTAPGAQSPDRIVHYRGRVHSILLALVLLGGIVSGAQMAAQSDILNWILAMLVMGQFGTDIPSGLRLVAWVAFGHALVLPLLLIFGSIMFVSNQFSDGGIERTELVFNGIFLLSTFTSVILFLVGRHLLVTFRNDRRLKLMAAKTQTETFNETNF